MIEYVVVDGSGATDFQANIAKYVAAGFTIVPGTYVMVMDIHFTTGDCRSVLMQREHE